MLESFQRHDVQVDGTRIHAVVGGDGPPVLLLHGYPQSHVMWHRVAPQLAERHTVILADLRGYGDSSRPASVPDHASYSRRAMAAESLDEGPSVAPGDVVAVGGAVVVAPGGIGGASSRIATISALKACSRAEISVSEYDVMALPNSVRRPQTSPSATQLLLSRGAPPRTARAGWRWRR